MLYNVIDACMIGENTLVTIEGKGERLRNNMNITDSEGKRYILISVGMITGRDAAERNETIVLIEGRFESKIFRDN